jgi:hypothetical protein
MSPVVGIGTATDCEPKAISPASEKHLPLPFEPAEHSTTRCIERGRDFLIWITLLVSFIAIGTATVSELNAISPASKRHRSLLLESVKHSETLGVERGRVSLARTTLLESFVVIGIAMVSEPNAISPTSEEGLPLPPESIEHSTTLRIERGCRFVVRTHLSKSLVATGRADLLITPPARNITAQVNGRFGLVFATSSRPTEFSNEGSESSRSFQATTLLSCVESRVLSVADTKRQPLSFPSTWMSRHLAFVFLVHFTSSTFAAPAELCSIPPVSTFDSETLETYTLPMKPSSTTSVPEGAVDCVGEDPTSDEKMAAIRSDISGPLDCVETAGLRI